MKISLSVIKADVGSIGGHTAPTSEMILNVRNYMQEQQNKKIILDFLITHTGDDIAIIMSHLHGINATVIHQAAWNAFKQATKVAQEIGAYGAGQDLLVDAPSSNVRGAGPGVAEISFQLREHDYRKAESFLVFAADKCGPGAFNLPLFLAFADPMFCAGLMLPQMINGFEFDIIDMNHKGEDLILTLSTPEDYYKIAILLRDNERFGIKEIRSRSYQEVAANLSTDRLHTIAGKYVGKDDPVALIRTQGIFPAPEELVSPYIKTHFVGGDARGSHVMPLMPVAINTAVTGFYCLPIISCLGFSLSAEGIFSNHYIDFFNNTAWDFVRLKAQEKAISMRAQGWSGAAMLPYEELEYSGYRTIIESLEKQFKLKTV